MALEAGQRCLREGDAAAAVGHLKEALGEPDGDTIDVRLVLAEALWQQAGAGGTDEALPHYEAAAAMAVKSGDAFREGMVALGHGFALSRLGRTEEARQRLERARALAEADGNAGVVQFADGLLAEVKSSAAAADDGKETTQATWRHFAEAIAAEKPAVIFLRGSLAAPLDEASLQGARHLRAAGCTKLEVVDVCNPGDGVPDGLQAISNSAHLAFPQLFVAGVELRGWLDLPAERLRNELGEAGVALGDPAEKEPCHGTGAFAEGLEPWEVALVELVSQKGTEDWASLAEALRSRGVGEPAGGCTADVLDTEWKRLAPLVKDKLQSQPEMPCGHSCSTCPTRHDCQLHDAVGDVRDIEDLVGG